MKYTRQQLENMSIEQLEKINKEDNRTNRGGPPPDNIETITYTIPEGNSLISFPYQLVNDSVNSLQEQNPHLDFKQMIGGQYGGTGIFDNDDDGFMEAGNLTTINNQYAYWLNLRGVVNNMTDIFELYFDVYPSEEPISYQLIGAGYTCPNRMISYDGIDNLPLLEALGAKAPFIQYIVGQGVGIWNQCLEEYFDNVNAGMDHWENTYNYSEDCWAGNLSQLTVGVGYWINVFCPGTSGNADGVAPHNMNDYYFNLGGGFTQIFNNFQWERPNIPDPKRGKQIKNKLSDVVVKNKIKQLGLKDKSGTQQSSPGKRANRIDRGGPPPNNIETITYILREGNNLISLPYDLVNTDTYHLQDTNPDIKFTKIVGSGVAIFDTNDDYQLDSGNLFDIDKTKGYWFHVYGPQVGVDEDVELSFDVYASSNPEAHTAQEPITYNLTGTYGTCGNNLISYDGIDGLSTIEAMGSVKAPHIRFIVGDGVGLFNICLDEYMDGITSEYVYDENTCWSGNLESLVQTDAYWVHLICQDIGYEIPEPGFTITFRMFTWERPSSKPPKKSINKLSNVVVKNKIKQLRLEDKSGTQRQTPIRPGDSVRDIEPG